MRKKDDDEAGPDEEADEEEVPSPATGSPRSCMM
jgi:hypothetical protein